MCQWLRRQYRIRTSFWKRLHDMKFPDDNPQACPTEYAFVVNSE